MNTDISIQQTVEARPVKFDSAYERYGNRQTHSDQQQVTPI